MYAERPARKAWTVPMLADAKREGRRLVMLTAYDASFARTLDDNGVDLVLVGDSLGMVVQGRNSTLPVVVDDIVYHTTCAARGIASGAASRSRHRRPSATRASCRPTGRMVRSHCACTGR